MPMPARIGEREEDGAAPAFLLKYNPISQGWEAMAFSKASKDVASQIRLFGPHAAIVVAVIVYVLLGAAVFRTIELPAEEAAKEAGLGRLRSERERLETELWNLSYPYPFRAPMKAWQWRVELRRRLDRLSLVMFDVMNVNYMSSPEVVGGQGPWAWSYMGAVLFAFSVVTTIGYGNIVPVTPAGRAFTLAYGMAGIPLTMLALANMGKFLLEGVKKLIKQVLFLYGWARYTIRRLRKRLLETCHRPAEGDEETQPAALEDDSSGVGNYTKVQNIIFKKSKIFRPLSDSNRPLTELSTKVEWSKAPASLAVLGGLVLLYLCLGSWLLPHWEAQLSFPSAFYFSFITITTTGLGDLVPENMGMLPVTLAYICFGVTITTLGIESAGDLIRKVHYMGRPVQGAKNARVNIGGKSITVGDLVDALGDKFGVPPDDIRDFVGAGLDCLVAEKIQAKEESRAASPLPPTPPPPAEKDPSEPMWGGLRWMGRGSFSPSLRLRFIDASNTGPTSSVAVARAAASPSLSRTTASSIPEL